MALSCAAGHVLGGAKRSPAPCPTCRKEAVAAQVHAADPTLQPDVIAGAIEAVTTSAAALRELFAALGGGPQALSAGAPPVVGRLVRALVTKGSRLALPRCSVCGREHQRLVVSGSVGICPRCRSHQLAVACAGCQAVRRVYGRDAQGGALCWSCAKRPLRVCGVCGQLRAVAEKAQGGRPDVCNTCYRRPIASCERCGERRRCNFVAAGHPICAACSPRRAVACAHCGAERPPSVRWSEGPVCEACYRAALSRRGRCEACGEQRRLVSPPGPLAARCCDCAGVPPLATCLRCGLEDRLYDQGLCVRCALVVRTRTLLSDASGSVPPGLLALQASIAAAPQPYSALNWIRQGAAAAMLTEIASGRLAVSHEALDRQERRGAAEYLRQMLVANGALAPRSEELARLERFVVACLAGIASEEDRRVVKTFATWAVLARFRRRVAGGAVVRTPNATQRIGAAADFLTWLRGRRIGLADLGQPDIEAWLTGGAPSSYDVVAFLRWASGRKLIPNIDVSPLAVRAGPALDDEQRWGIVARLLHDEALELTDRVAGCLVLLYAQRLTRIVAITLDQVITRDDGVYLRLGTGEVPIPEPLGALILALAISGRRYVGVGSPAITVWLFPGLYPGRPLSPARLGERLRKLGIKTQAGRRAALMHLAAALPAAVLADTLGLHTTTAAAWVRTAGGNWSSYAAEVARGRNREEC